MKKKQFGVVRFPLSRADFLPTKLVIPGRAAKPRGEGDPGVRRQNSEVRNIFRFPTYVFQLPTPGFPSLAALRAASAFAKAAADIMSL
jgi:hypothetical protein